MKSPALSGAGHALLAIACILLAACARDVRVAPFPVNEAAVTVLLPAAPTDEADRVVGMLREALPGASFVSFADWDHALERAVTERRTVIVPNARAMPAPYQDVLDAYLARGVKLLLIGREVYDKPAVITADGVAQSHTDYRRDMMQRATDLPDFSAVQLWRHENSDPARRSRVRIARDPRLPWPGVEVEVEHLDLWDSMRLPEVPDELSKHPHATLAFYARGSARTSRLLVRAREQDGSLWVRAVPAHAGWEPVLIRPHDWIHVEGGWARGGPDDRFDVSKLQSLGVGLDARYTPHSAGAHSYGLSDMRLVQGGDYRRSPGAPLAANPDARYSFTANQIEGRRSGALYHIGRTTVDALWPIPEARYPDEATRWIPLFTARDRRGEAAGHAGGLFIRLPEDGAPRVWAWIGLDVTRGTRAAVRAMVNECLFNLQRGRFLVGTTSDRTVFRVPDMFTAKTRVYSANPDPALVRVTAELVDRDGVIIRRIVTAPLSLERDDALGPIDLNAGVVPRATERAVDYTLNIHLEEVGGRSLIFDRTAQPVKVLGERATSLHAELPGISGSRITMGRIPVFFLGVDYNPGLNRRAADLWLQAERFPAALVRNDLDRLRAAGINTVGLTYTDTAQAPQLRYVLEETHARGMWAYIRFPTFMQRAHDTTWMEEMIRALNLAGDTDVVYFDLAPGDATHAEADDMWHIWLAEQYGHIEIAADALGDLVLWDNPSGLTPYPPPARLAGLPDDAAAWRVMRRFGADMNSRRLGQIVRALRQAGCRQLMTASLSVQGEDLRRAHRTFGVPFDFRTGIAHLDFVSIGADHLRGHEPNYSDHALLAAYARGLTEGRPIVWTGVSVPAGPYPREIDIDNQARALNEWARLVLGTQSAGLVAGHYAAVSHDPLDADAGLVHPDRSPRPALHVYRETANRLRAYRITPTQWAGRETDMDPGARGVHSLWDHWGRVYREELADHRVEELRPTGFGRSSQETPRDRVDGGERGPFTFLNSEWGHVEIDGRPVVRKSGEPIRMGRHQVLRAQVINTGLAHWAASRDRVDRTVWIWVDHSARRAQYLEVNETAPRRTHIVEWRPTDAGTCVLRPYWLGVDAFGEALSVEVTEPTP